MRNDNIERCIITVGKPDAHREIHFGHLAGGLINADIYARFLRRQIGDENVLFLSGTECYGSAVETAFFTSDRTFDSIELYVEHMHKEQLKTLSDFQISFNNFFCDVSEKQLHQIHTDICQKMVDCLYENGDLYKKNERILVDRNGLFLNYRQVTQKLHEKSKNNLQINKYNKETTDNLISNFSGTSPEEKYVENFFFDFSKREHSLIKMFSLQNPKYVSYVEKVFANSQDSVSKPFRLTGNAGWGIEVSVDGQKKNLWVWIDSILAPFSYTIKECGDYEKALDWWNKDSSVVVHYIAEDNLKFYCALESYLLSAWSDSRKEIIRVPELKLTPMRTVKCLNNIPTGKELLEYYTTEQIRYSIASMGERQSSFYPERIIKQNFETDHIISKCESTLRKINKLVQTAKWYIENSNENTPSCNVINAGEKIYHNYCNEMYERRTHRALDIIEQNLRIASNCGINSIYLARLFLHMLYPILPDYATNKYEYLFNDDDIFSSWEFTG